VETQSSVYAVITAGGKQHRVKVGQRHQFELMQGEPGDKVQLGEALLIGDGDKTTIGAPNVAGTQVLGTIVEHGRKDKITIIKMRRRKGYRRKQGHRQWFTLVEITDINH